MAKLIKGENLSPEQIKEVKAAFINRFTSDFRPQWANREDCKTCVPTHRSDEEWIIDHAFYFRKDGSLASTHRHCVPVYMAE